MAITNPTKFVSVQRLGRFKENLDEEFATKQEVSQATIIPIDLETLTPQTTFVKNSIVAIKGIMYRAKKDTTRFPVALQVQDGHFVCEIVDGAPVFVVEDWTPAVDWEVWGDASIPQTLYNMQDTIDESIEQMESEQHDFIINATQLVSQSVKLSQMISNTAGTKQYTVQQLLTALADLMDKEVVADESDEES